MHHKRTGPKSTRGGCLLCHPHKHQAMRHTSNGQARQERLARLSEREQRREDLPDFSKVRDVWQGLPCPDSEHVWAESGMLIGYDTCRVCGADREHD